MHFRKQYSLSKCSGKTAGTKDEQSNQDRDKLAGKKRQVVLRNINRVFQKRNSFSKGKKPAATLKNKCAA
ncbi:hypothetical protein VN23_09470 [Janthinobacterium sp. B9-8]|nr:hypothetical protein VN23_09470 [Janthinobacterium sp. B9-8]